MRYRSVSDEWNDTSITCCKKDHILTPCTEGCMQHLRRISSRPYVYAYLVPKFQSSRNQTLTTYRNQVWNIFICYNFCVIDKAICAFIDKGSVIWLCTTFSNTNQCSFYFLKVLYCNNSITAQRLLLFDI